MSFEAFREEERHGWSERAGEYGQATARATLQVVPALLAALRLFPGAAVLDVGCGPGYAAGAAAALGADCVGFDIAPAMVAAAKKAFPGIPFFAGDFEAMALASESRDAVVANIVLFHVAAPEQAVQEAWRVLRPGGRFAFSQWCAPAESACYRLLLDAVSSHADLSLASPAPDAFDLSDRMTAKALLERAGFSDLAVAEVPSVLQAPGPSFFDFFMRFGVRIPAILQKQALAVRARIKRDVDRLASRYRSGDSYRVPMPAFVVSGTRGT